MATVFPPAAEAEAFAFGGSADGFYAPSSSANATPAAGPFSSMMPAAPYLRGGNPYGTPAPTPLAGSPIEDYDNEPPLLQELGVDFSHIRMKVTAVLLLHRPIEPHIMGDEDLAGPLVFCLILGCCLLLSGKLHFSYIYGFGLLGCVGIYAITNLMLGTSAVGGEGAGGDATADGGVGGRAGSAVTPSSLAFSKTFSLMGYCLLPIVLLAALAIFVRLQGPLGVALGAGAILWSTLSCARFFEAALGMGDRKWLIAYPAGLFYAVFALMTIF